ncbi:hypothetical protein PRK78_006573 [Emydomyces testavorans]|uniref:Uncharacterized protein n=1 Tax=Emydomyces testavorans TaxID=2070801 RepID=A0AAF0DMN2_9EURO|nr:hypothetical protein PRK78_006573 [Emydomyces testavorans]
MSRNLFTQAEKQLAAEQCLKFQGTAQINVDHIHVPAVKDTKNSTDIGKSLRTSLIEEYCNKYKPTDGEIYHKIQQYQQEGNTYSENRWWSQLSSNKSNNKDDLLQHLSNHNSLKAAFDNLLDIPGLWGGLRIRNDQSLMAKINQHDVETLQSRAPAASEADFQFIKGRVLSGKIFGGFTEQEHDVIWKQLQTCKHLILSLFTFFEDFKYLEICADAMKHLFSISDINQTIQQAAVSDFKGSNESNNYIFVQIPNGNIQKRAGSTESCLELYYHQLWLYIMHEYPNLPKETKGSNKLLAKTPMKVDKEILHKLAVLARIFGFELTQINTLVENHPDHLIARAALLKA